MPRAVACLGAVAFCATGALAHGDLDAAVGKAVFQRQWVPAPSSTRSNDGLGPLFNARSCAQCHAAAGGGRIEVDAKGRLAGRGLVVRFSGRDGRGDPLYGAQLQTRAVPGESAEGDAGLSWEQIPVTLADGMTVTLRRPRADLDLRHGAIAETTAVSLLLAPSLAAAAAIARVDTEALQRLHGGGRLSRDGTGRLLIYGRKASEPDLAHAISLAFARDLGLSTPLVPEPAGDCTPAQASCRAGPHGDEQTGIEIAEPLVDALAAYIAGLESVRSSRDEGAMHKVSVQETKGAALFQVSGCADCHRPRLPAADGGSVTLFSDLRLHDLGEALAALAGAQGQQPGDWRTAPLLGIGRRLAAGATLLHDGRARSPEEAILWHGGGGKASRDAYANLPAAEREALLNYVGSL